MISFFLAYLEIPAGALSLRVIFQEIRVVGDLSLGSGGSRDDHSVVHPLVLLVTRLNRHMEMEPVLAGVDRPSLHQRLQHLWRASSRTLRTIRSDVRVRYSTLHKRQS